MNDSPNICFLGELFFVCVFLLGFKTWTLDSGLDYGLDYNLDYGLDYRSILDSILDLIWTEQHYVQTNLMLQNFLGLFTVQFLIASSLVQRLKSYTFFQCSYMAVLRPGQCIGR